MTCRENGGRRSDDTKINSTILDGMKTYTVNRYQLSGASVTRVSVEAGLSLSATRAVAESVGGHSVHISSHSRDTGEPAIMVPCLVRRSESRAPYQPIDIM